MQNTVLLKGKGMGVIVFFLALAGNFPDATIHEPALRWWQSTTRYELRLQNLTVDEIVSLQYSISLHGPLTSYISLEVF